ncbi:MAG: protein phosphatase 2C domain-containing protein [Ruminococcus flavefaciens]|nr:protein phosphatase 2C domain-containing protein [Ruminococcus flavefaciens]MCM1230431.1 protein phosphatase 2C domain-containing protein [Ruminococcus flavefaciens]
MYYCCGITEKGIMSHNEDAVLVGQDVITDGSLEKYMESPFIVAVSDGVSGENAGELASAMCLENLSRAGSYRPDSLASGIMRIHNKLADFSRDNSETNNMQATLCGIAVDGDGTVTAFNVGDSRLYRFRAGELRQLSRDQSLVQLLYEEGAITQEERRTHVHKNIIFPVLGNIKDSPTIDTTVIDGALDYGDVLIMCTDGLSDYVSTADMLEIMELPKNLAVRLEMLVKKALSDGGRDNISIVAVVRTESGC